MTISRNNQTSKIARGSFLDSLFALQVLFWQHACLITIQRGNTNFRAAEAILSKPFNDRTLLSAVKF